jgi:hypothetical protein
MLKKSLKKYQTEIRKNPKANYRNSEKVKNAALRARSENREKNPLNSLRNGDFAASKVRQKCKFRVRNSVNRVKLPEFGQAYSGTN